MGKRAARVDETREVLLSVAERLFAANGYSGVSVREITKLAKVNVSSVSYYFGGKRELYSAVYARRMGPVTEKRIAAFRSLADRRKTEEVDLTSILEALVWPLLDVLKDTNGVLGLEFINRAHNESDELFETLVVPFHGEMWYHLMPLLEAALPNIPKDVLYWRAYFAVGDIFHICRQRRWLKQYSGGLCDSSDLDQAGRHLVRFLSVGLREAD